MKIFVISLYSATARRKSIVDQFEKLKIEFDFIDAIDGRGFSKEELIKYTDYESVIKNRKWLSNGAIGCALSHLKAYKKLIDDDLDEALILEDDVLLTNDFADFLKSYQKAKPTIDILLLYYTSWKPCKLYQSSKIDFGIHSIFSPVDFNQPITAAAYIISKETCLSLVNTITPIKYAADSWGDFYKMGSFRDLRCVYPMVIDVIDAKSTINYIDGKTTNFFKFIDYYKLFPFYQILKMRRKWMRKKMLNVEFI